MRRSVRWGLGDAVLVFVVPVLVGLIASSFVIAATNLKADRHGHYPVTATLLLATIFGQYGVWVAYLAFTSARKGLGTVRADFGLVVDLVRDWPFFLMGFALEIVAGIAVLPISNLVSHGPQSVVKDLQNATGLTRALLVVTAVLIAPVVEELFFRGLLLRAVQRRTSAATAVTVSALAFALVHPLLDPGFGSLVIVPALVALGMVSGVLAVRSGNLSRSILLHAGFNIVTVLVVVK